MTTEKEKTPYTSHGTHVRVEPGPALVQGRADPETLHDNVTASHYQLGMKDAMGREIRELEDFHYLDYKGERVWYVYELMDEPVLDASGATIRDPDSGEPLINERWVERGVYKTEAAATEAAKKLAK